MSNLPNNVQTSWGPGVKLFLSLPEAAEMTGTSVAFWRKRVLFQEIETVHVGRLVKISREAVMAYLAARTRPARVTAK